MAGPSLLGRAGAFALRTAALAGVLATLLFLFLTVARPWYLRWGATDDEVRRALPGDDLVPSPAGQETRAITIDAPIERVWPWFAQLGQDRAGFYSFDLIENLVGCEMPVDDRLRADRQRWTVGDRLWMYPPEKAGGVGFATLRVYEPGRVLMFGTRMLGTPLSAPENGSWGFVLEPAGPGSTRVLARGRDTAVRSRLGATFDHWVFEPMHFVMERRMLVGIASLAETGQRSRAANHVHLALFTVSLLLMLACAGRVLAGRAWLASLAGVALGGLLFGALTLLQPPLVVGIPAVVLLACLYWLGSGGDRAAGRGGARRWSGGHPSRQLRGSAAESRRGFEGRPRRA